MSESAGQAKEITYRDALRIALGEEMTRDSRVVLMGEEVGRYGGAYGVSRGLLEKFGEQRVFDTPISEAAIVGAAVGAAMTGLRPVAELMYVDFVALAMDQIANQAAKIRYMFGGQMAVPMVLRTQGGTGRSAGAQHSQSLEAWIMHTPGLRLAMPATVTDAYSLLRDAIRCEDPVVLIEHKSLYTSKGVLDPGEALSWGRAAKRRQGSDVTLVTYSRMLKYSLEAAAKLESDGIDMEVIDLRTLNPLDMDTVSESVRKTKRAIVVTEDTLTAGVSAELSARISESCFHSLAEPVARVAGHDIPIPVAPALEKAAIPSAEEIETAVRKLVNK
jgi:pyruvate/2-oxoglutarate/acetoin dehydrogenase E1 component